MSNGPMIFRAADATTTSRPAPPPRRPAPFPSAATALRRLRRRTTLALTLLVGSSSLLGCSATVPKPVAPDLRRPDELEQAERSLSASPPRPATCVSGGRSWATPRSSDLVAKALVASPDLRTARARLREARARRALAGKDYAPTVDASLSGTRTKSSGADGHTQLGAAFDASWDPDIFGATRNAVGAAQADLQATAADLDNTQVSLVAELGRNYVECRALQARITIARNSLERQAETLALTSWREQAGLTSELDVEQSRTNLEQTRAQIPSLETALAEAKHRMAVLLGQPPAALDELLASSGPIPSVPLQLVHRHPRRDVASTPRRSCFRAPPRCGHGPRQSSSGLAVPELSAVGLPGPPGRHPGRPGGRRDHCPFPAGQLGRAPLPPWAHPQPDRNPKRRAGTGSRRLRALHPDGTRGRRELPGLPWRMPDGAEWRWPKPPVRR